MANYNRFELLESELADLHSLRAHFPFRKWFAVKPLVGQAMFVDSLRKAKKLAAEHNPATIYQATIA